MPKGHRATVAERDLQKQIEIAGGIVARAVKSGQLGNATKAQVLLVRLTADLNRRRSARLAAGIRDPVRHVAAMRTLAEADGSWLAAARLASDERALRTALQREAEESERAASRVGVSAQDWEMFHREAATAMTREELDIYVVEWARRTGALIEVGQDGLPVARQRS